jgi:S-adenosylmethionine:tRNA-ribosyltransferase-isomerase (queuine synthetase)
MTGILFDLDGTLLNTLEDLLSATNYALKVHGYPERTLAELRQFVGNGAYNQMRLSVPEGTEPEKIQEVLDTYKPYYTAHCQIKTRPYEGIPEALALLAGKYPLAIVSNKPDAAVKALCADYFPGIYALGEAPLPREVINRPSEPEDLEDFQTVFAKNEGAVTAPISGLHFSPQLLKMMEIKGIEQAFVTLHCGLGCFRSIDVEDLTKHKTDSEEMHVTQEACDIINNAKKNGRRIVAVGTTVQRVLETAVSADNNLKPYDGWTNKFIIPPYDFHIADAMVANFYNPLSTMLMLTAAYGGYDLVMKAYKEAMRYNESDPSRRYRFGTFGDAMLILND